MKTSPLIRCGNLVVLLLIVSCVNLFAGEPGIHAQIDALTAEKHFAAAEKTALEFLQEHPDDTEALCALACVYRNRSRKSGININTAEMGIKDGENGQFEIKESTDLEKIFNSSLYLDPKDHDKAEKLYFQIIEHDPGYQNAYFNLLNDYVVLEDYDAYFKVIDLYIANLKQTKDSADNLNELAAKLLEKKAYDEALKLYTIIVKHYPDYHDAKSDMGAAYSQMGKIIEARQIFREVYAKAPTDLINLKNYYFTSLLTEEFATAYDLLDKIIEADADETEQLYDLAFISLLLGKDHKVPCNRYMEKRAAQVEDIKQDFWYQTAHELSGIESLDNEARLSFLNYLLDQFHNAEFSGLEIIVANLIEQIEVTNYALMIHTSVFDRHMFLEKTVEYLDKISKRRETDPGIITEQGLNWNYGRIYYTAEKYEQAKGYFLKNYSNNINDAQNNYYLGKCHLFLGNKTEAVRLFSINKDLNDKEQMTYINYSIRELSKM